jgi:putative cardiolipin synthase
MSRGALVLLVTMLLGGCAGTPLPAPGPPSEAIPIGESAFLDHEVQRELSGQPGISAVRLVQQNPLAFAYRLETARRAERSLDVQYYIWHADYTGRFLAAELVLAAERGVRVRVLLDGLDMRDRQHALAIADSHPNLEVRLFNPFLGSALGLAGELLQRGGRLNHRMHNKAWIADNRVAILGGRNIGDEYFGAAEDANFSDTGLVVGGPAVAQASREFDRYWNSAVVTPVTSLTESGPGPAQLQQLLQESRDYGTRAGKAPFAVALQDPARLAERLAMRPAPIKVRDVQVVADDPDKMESTARGARGARASRVLDAVMQRARQAERELLIVSPYFVPGEDGAAILLALAKRGVRVAVLTNSLAATDVAGVHAGYSKYRKALLAGGVELYEMKRTASDAIDRKRLSLTGSSQASLHTKAVTVDGRWTFIGSMNLDPRSVNINTEMGALLESEELAAQMRAQFASTSLPEVAYAVRLVDGRLRWTDSENGRERVFDSEPEASFARRAAAALLRLLPLESQL